MIAEDDLIQLSSVYQTAESFLIFLSNNASTDQICAGLSLHHALTAQGKPSRLVCTNFNATHLKELPGVDQISPSAGNHTLRVTFPYLENQVDHVSYQIDQEKKEFYLLVKPKRGTTPLDFSNVQYAHIGIDAQMIFLIGISDYQQIQPFYEQDENAFHQAHTVSVNRTSANFAVTNLDLSGYTSYSECLYRVLHGVQLPLNDHAATCLLSGIDQATNGFRHMSVTADTFELVALLMRAGASRIQMSNGTATRGASSLAEAFAQTAPKPTLFQPKPVTPVKPPMQMPSQYAPPAR